MSRFAHTISYPLAALLALACTAGASAWAHGADEPYALVRANGQGMSISGDGDASFAVDELKRRIHGDFLWFRQDGRAYLIQDPQVLAKARAAYVPLDRLSEQMNAYGRDMDRQGKAMNALGQEMGQAASGIQPDEAKMHAIERRMSELGERIGRVSAHLANAGDDERPRLNAEMARLNQQMAELGRQMGMAAHAEGERQARLAMKQVSLRMDEAGKPMDELGHKMDALGKDMDRASHDADRNVHALIHDAMARGLARPVPQD